MELLVGDLQEVIKSVINHKAPTINKSIFGAHNLDIGKDVNPADEASLQGDQFDIFYKYHSKDCVEKDPAYLNGQCNIAKIRRARGGGEDELVCEWYEQWRNHGELPAGFDKLSELIDKYRAENVVESADQSS